MLSNALGIHRVVVATGFVDMRKGIDGLATIVKENYKLDLLRRAPCSSSAEEGLTASSSSCGWAMDSSSAIKGLRTVP